MSSHRGLIMARQTQGEEWRSIPGYEDRYDISSAGRVRSWLHNRHGKRLSPRVLRLSLSSGYPAVHLCKDKTVKSLRVHHLVLLAFVGPPEEGQVCAHADGDRTNNSRNNLRWATYAENEADKRSHGRMVPREEHWTVKDRERCIAVNREKGWKCRGDKNGLRLHPESVLRGEKNPRAIFTEEEVRSLRREYAASGSPRGRRAELAAQYGVSRHAIKAIQLRRNWKHLD
jgi:hypothetical protein